MSDPGRVQVAERVDLAGVGVTPPIGEGVFATALIDLGALLQPLALHRAAAHQREFQRLQPRHRSLHTVAEFVGHHLTGLGGERTVIAGHRRATARNHVPPATAATHDVERAVHRTEDEFASIVGGFEPFAGEHLLGVTQVVDYLAAGLPHRILRALIGAGSTVGADALLVPAEFPVFAHRLPDDLSLAARDLLVRVGAVERVGGVAVVACLHQLGVAVHRRRDVGPHRRPRVEHLIEVAIEVFAGDQIAVRVLPVRLGGLVPCVGVGRERFAGAVEPLAHRVGQDRRGFGLGLVLAAVIRLGAGGVVSSG